MKMIPALQIAILFLIGFVALPTEGVNITADFGTAQDGKTSPASLSANVGDSIVWNVYSGKAPTGGDLPHGVYFHPSGTCSQLGRVQLHHGVDGLASYTFTGTDAGKTIFFASENQSDCEAGQHLSVLVLPEQREARSLQSLTDKPTLTAGNLTSTPTPPTTLPTPQPVSELVSPSPVTFNIQQSSAPTVANVQLPTPNPTPVQTPPPTNLPTVKSTPLPTLNATPLPTPFPTPNATPPPTPNPTLPPTPFTTTPPTPNPTARPTPVPTPSQTTQPTLRPTPNPTFLPTLSPTLSPTPKPTAPPTPEQTPSPTRRPTPAPTPFPTPKPSPTPKPNPMPTRAPTPAPVIPPSPSPSASPTQNPVAFAVEPDPTNRPTNPPTPEPIPETPSPTKSPVSTLSPTKSPVSTLSPTKSPVSTLSPTKSPVSTLSPTKSPVSTRSPTDSPTKNPTEEPTRDPTPKPTPFPTPFPTLKPVTSAPTFAPSSSSRPSLAPSKAPVWTLSLGTVESPTPGGEQGTPPPTESDITSVTGTVKFTVLVAGGNRDQIPFESYSSELTSIVDMLALEVAEALKTPSGNEQSKRKRNGPRDLMQTQVGEDQKRLLQHLGVDTPASITNVQRVGFTADPDLSDSNVFLGGACPASLGSTAGDRCEEVTASIDLFVPTQFNVDEIQKAFQQELEKSVSRGRLQYFLKENYPGSILTIASGQRIASSDSASTQDVSTETTEVAPGAITGIVLAIASGGLLTVLLLFVTRRRQVKANWKDDSIDVTVERASIDGKTLPEVTGLEWGPPEDIQYSQDVPYNEDIDDWSAPSNVSSKPTIVVLPTEHVDDYPQPLDDNFSTASVDDHKDTQSIAESVTSGLHPGDRSAFSEKTGQCSSLGSVSSTGFMSGNQVVDLHEGSLRDYTPGITDFDDLEAAIIAGDWAAVGATAAALAGQQDGSVCERQTVASWDEESRDMSTRSKTWQDVIDATKAAELDHLIEQGNWAAIIEVAAKYEWETKEGHDADHGDV